MSKIAVIFGAVVLALVLAVVFMAQPGLGAPDTSPAYYFPIVERNFAELGTHLDGYDGASANWTPYLVEGAIYQIDAWVYLIETSPGEYDWTNFDARVNTLTPYASKLIVGVKDVPSWAREWITVTASRPSRDYWEYYGNFINMVIDHANPWGVEIWNEPAQKCCESMAASNGCWIPPMDDEPSDEDFIQAGENYALMLQTIIPIIRAEHPEVKIIIGAISGYDANGQQKKFVQGIQSVGFSGADYFSMHLYLKSDNVRDLQPAYFQLTFDATDRLYKDTGLPVILSETSIRMADSTNPGGYDDMQRTPSPQFLLDQDEYFQYIMANIDRHMGLRAVLWFTVAGGYWNNTDLIYNVESGDNKYKPVYCSWAEFLGHPEACPEQIQSTPVPATDTPMPIGTPDPLL